MRNLTGTERSRLQAPKGFWCFAYFRVQNYDGTWVNLGHLVVGSRTLNLFTAMTWNDHVDQNTLSMSVTLVREIGAYSLSPFRSDSPINVDDSGTYQPLLDLHRQWDLWGVFTPIGTYPDPADYRQWAAGWADRIDIQGDPATITVQGFGMEKDLIDRRIMFVDATADPLVPITDATPKVYAGGTQADVIQAILDEELGAGVITLTVDASAPSEFVNGWNQTTDVGMFDLLTQVASLGGGSLRYKYDASDVLSLTLYSVDRNPSNADWQADADEYEKLDVGIGLDAVRNFVAVRYQDTNFGIQVVTSPVAPPYPPTSPSIARFGVRPLGIDLSAETQVTDQTGAGGLADAVVADLEFPVIEQQATGTGWWFAELGDYVKLLANSVHYNEDQFGGITSVSHTLENGELVTVLGLAGKPKGRYLTWLDFGPGAPRVPLTPTLTSLDATFSEVQFLFTIPEIQWTGVAGRYTNSVLVEYSDDPTFATTIATSNHAATPGDPVTGGTILALDADRDTTYYVRATPYSGPIVAGAVSGVAGEQYVANTYAPLKPSDSPTLEWDFGTPGQLKANVVGAAPTGSAGGVLAGTYPDPSFSATGTADATTFLRGDNTWATLSGGSGASEVTPTITTASLANNATETGTVTVAKSAFMQKMVASAACWVRFYETSAARTSDASRAITTSPKAGLGILSNVAPGLDSAGLTVPITPAHELHNGDGPRTTTIYYAITNKSGSTAAITVDLTCLAIES